MSTSNNRGLRVAVLSNGPVWQFWQATCLDRLLEVPGVEVVLHVVPKRHSTSGSFPQRLVSAKWSTFLYRRWRQRGFSCKAMEELDVSNHFSGVPLLEVEPTGFGAIDQFNSDDLSRISHQKPDVIIRFGFNILKGEILSIARFGVWSFHHGDNEKFRGGPPGIWEILKGEKVMGVVLQRLTEDLDNGYILKKGFYPVIHHSLSDTLNASMIDSAIWPAQLCRRLLRGRDYVALGERSTTKGKLFRYPSNGTFLRFRMTLLRNKMRFHREELNKHEEWNIGVYYHPISDLLKEHPNRNVRWLPNPQKGSFRADPFGFMKNGELVVLYEKWDSQSGKGVISRVRPKPDNILKRSKTVLDLEQHLSYPFVLEQDGRILVIPECFMSGSVSMYELSEDMNELKLLGTILDEPLLDPTLVHFDGLWWLMGTLPPNTNVGLHLYYSENLMGPFKAHVMNPVKSDISGSRPAGTPFMHNGQLYRPAQDSSKTYGGEIIIHRVIRMDPEDFHEVEERRIPPMPGSAHDLGIHTISSVGPNITLVDGKRFVTHQDKKRASLKRKFTKLMHRK